MNKEYMTLALELSQTGRYCVSPNPLVGCVIEKDGEIIATGYHKGVGAPHAEIEALNKAGEKAKGANVYVTLEPCCHFGNTPPCVDALIKAQVSNVYISMLDPNPLVNGKGVDQLRGAGINIEIGCLKDEAEKINEFFLHHVTTKMPFITVKWAATLDGKIATGANSSKWISNEQSREHSHDLRHQHDAVLVGANTIIRDNPQLTVRNKVTTGRIRHPIRIILDGQGKSHTSSRIYQKDFPGKTMVITTTSSAEKWRKKLIANGVEVLMYDHEIDLKQLLYDLGKRNITSILVEGGAKTITPFFGSRLVNKIYCYIAPKIIGGTGALTPVANLGIDKMTSAIVLQKDDHKCFGEDIMLTYYPRWDR